MVGFSIHTCSGYAWSHDRAQGTRYEIRAHWLDTFALRGGPGWPEISHVTMSSKAVNLCLNCWMRCTSFVFSEKVELAADKLRLIKSCQLKPKCVVARRYSLDSGLPNTPTSSVCTAIVSTYQCNEWNSCLQIEQSDTSFSAIRQSDGVQSRQWSASPGHCRTSTAPVPTFSPR